MSKTKARAQFYNLKLGEPFFIKNVPCRKTSSITYVITGSDEFLGEISYDPTIDNDVKTVEEMKEATAPPAVKKLKTSKSKS